MRSRLAIEASCEEFLQPRGEDDYSDFILQTNLFKYFGIFAPNAERVA
jgi:hypothetical protein